MQLDYDLKDQANKINNNKILMLYYFHFIILKHFNVEVKPS